MWGEAPGHEEGGGPQRSAPFLPRQGHLPRASALAAARRDAGRARRARGPTGAALVATTRAALAATARAALARAPGPAALTGPILAGVATLAGRAPATGALATAAGTTLATAAA